MRILSYVFETTLRFSEPVVDHSFVLRCLPKPTNTQKVMESQLFTHPRITLSEQVDGFGNRIVVGYCPEAHDTFDFYSSGLVMVSAEDAAETPAHPMFLQFTNLTQPSDDMRAFACDVAGGVELASPGEVLGVAQRICAQLHEEFAYTPGATSTQTTAAQAFAHRRGVCQDYAHVLVSLCRVLGIPARYVTGLMTGEGVSHAWAEVHDGVRWWGLDPTNNRMAGDDYMLFSTGRDFVDCPIERGVFRGNAEQTQTVTASLGDDTPAVNEAKSHLRDAAQ